MIRLTTILIACLALAAVSTSAVAAPTKVCHPKKHKCAVHPKPKPRPPVTPPAPPPPALGTRTNPLAIGQANTGGSWLIAVNNVTPDATAAVLGTNRFNSPPSPGRQFFMVNFTAKFVGPPATASARALQVLLVAVGASQNIYSAFDSDCGVVPSPSLIDYGDVLPGATVTANICWSVLGSDVSSLEMAWKSSAGLAFFWALHS